MKNPIATITMENGAVMTAELYPDKAPNTVANFISLANKGFYDGLIFHRVIPGFMIQGGCPKGNGTGGPGYDIKGEFAGNGFAQNDLKHTTGVLSMARAMHPDSAGSQFFIMVAPASHLDGQYAAFGQVTEGVEEAIRISEVPTDWNDKPKTPVVIQSIRVDTQGVDYPEPKKR
ncbi:peptidylprolyl isomerase [Oscillibacter valericigenes]|uniref:peptidylprolyl isomerase n=1 Tax=Oscillibacter valericigenes TaxID=351091 RepID=UPI0030B8872C